MLIEDVGDESDIDSEDEVEEREGDSVTEQDGEETDEDEERRDNKTNSFYLGRVRPGPSHTTFPFFYLGRDNKTMWAKKPPGKRKRKESHNIITNLPGVIGNAKNAKTAVECWNNIFSDEILDMIDRYTNQYMYEGYSKSKRERDISSTDVIELWGLYWLVVRSRSIQR
ncbi:uncharacterized protein LOC126456352 [Schistocerca serialis cubense]|uniref:uncharacterized protein LOC126456352 n=1 Tax=Schistocerca serialis cubense TaxID=2023355 RepID=UPI00214E2B4F|nr:uncharacterized protein LOC126456352 [Schistocerca serialis cubense]